MDAITVMLIMWNIFTFSLMGIDKYKAIHSKKRISELALIISAFLMGGFGSLMGSLFFHHKTKKVKFRILLPLAVICNLIIIFLFIKQF